MNQMSASNYSRPPSLTSYSHVEDREVKLAEEVGGCELGNQKQTTCAEKDGDCVCTVLFLPLTFNFDPMWKLESE